jgi:hypothetical protein
MAKHSVRKINSMLLEDIKKALKNIKGWGSVEIYVQDHRVTQITERNIKKTKHDLGSGTR